MAMAALEMRVRSPVNFFMRQLGFFLPWLAEGCLGIDLLVVLYFSPGSAEVIDEITDGAI